MDEFVRETLLGILSIPVDEVVKNRIHEKYSAHPWVLYLENLQQSSKPQVPKKKKPSKGKSVATPSSASVMTLSTYLLPTPSSSSSSSLVASDSPSQPVSLYLSNPISQESIPSPSQAFDFSKMPIAPPSPSSSEDDDVSSEYFYGKSEEQSVQLNVQEETSLSKSEEKDCDTDRQPKQAQALADCDGTVTKPEEVEGIPSFSQKATATKSVVQKSAEKTERRSNIRVMKVRSSSDLSHLYRIGNSSSSSTKTTESLTETPKEPMESQPRWAHKPSLFGQGKSSRSILGSSRDGGAQDSRTASTHEEAIENVRTPPMPMLSPLPAVQLGVAEEHTLPALPTAQTISTLPPVTHAVASATVNQSRPTDVTIEEPTSSGRSQPQREERTRYFRLKSSKDIPRGAKKLSRSPSPPSSPTSSSTPRSPTSSSANLTPRSTLPPPPTSATPRSLKAEPEKHVRIDAAAGEGPKARRVRPAKKRPLSMTDSNALSLLKVSHPASSTNIALSHASIASSASAFSSSSTSLIPNILKKSAKFDEETVKKVEGAKKEGDHGSPKKEIDSSEKRVFTWQTDLSIGETGNEESASQVPQTRKRRVTTIFPDDSEADHPQVEKKKESMRPRDWNQQFQAIVRRIHDIEEGDSLREKKLLNDSLYQLIQDFNTVAKMYGRIIILERHLPTREEARKQHGPKWVQMEDVITKTIEPVGLGGIAGGDKYIVNNIVFKFAVDSRGIYAGDHWASKAAGLELLAMSSYFSTSTPGLSLPLMTLVNFLGYRLIAVSNCGVQFLRRIFRLPINDRTLVYGSSDGGMTLHNSNKHFNEMAKYTAKMLNLRTHWIQPAGKSGSNTKKRELHSAWDMEGHIGTDNRFYFLDFARAMPSDDIKRHPWFQNVPNAALVCRFRPELLSRFSKTTGKTLTPDSPFETSIAAVDPKVEEMGTDIRMACEHLENVLIQQATQTLVSEAEVAILQLKISPYNLKIPSVVHSLGINLRYLGEKRNYLRNPRTFIPIFALLSAEAVARAIKNYLNEKIRGHMEQLSLAVEAPYRVEMIRELNIFFRYDDSMKKREETERRWFEIRQHLNSFFGFLDPTTLQATVTLVRGVWEPGILDKDANPFIIQGESYTCTEIQKIIADLDPDKHACGPYLLFKRLTQLIHFRVSKSAILHLRHYSPLFTQTNGEFPEEARRPFSQVDLEKIYVHIKGMNLGLNAQANYFYSQAEYIEMRRGDRDLALEYYLTAKCLYSEILSSFPSDCETLLNLGVSMTKALLIKYNGLPFSLDDSEVESTRQTLQMAMSIGKSARLYIAYAQFLSYCNEIEKADISYLKAIKSAPYCARFYMTEYSIFLKKNYQNNLSFIFYLRSKLISEIMEKSIEILRAYFHNTTEILDKCDEVIVTVSKTIHGNEYFSLAENFALAWGSVSMEKNKSYSLQQLSAQLEELAKTQQTSQLPAVAKAGRKKKWIK